MKPVLISILFLLSISAYAQTRSTAEVYNHHAEALLNRDKAELMKDYDENSVLITPDGKVNKGLKEISNTFDYALSEVFPLQIELYKIQEVIQDEIVFLVYKVSNAATGEMLMPFAVDTFVIKDGKIRYQTVAAQMPEQKE